MKRKNTKKQNYADVAMRYITAIIIAFMVASIVYNIPRPKEVEGQKLEEVKSDLPYQQDIQIIRESEPRSIKEEIQYVFGDKWELAYAVMMAEGGLKPKQKSHKSYWCESLNRKAWDYGIFQFSECYHPEVSYECATDIKCATNEAYRVSNGGTDFSEWYGYTKGGYKKFL